MFEQKLIFFYLKLKQNWRNNINNNYLTNKIQIY